MHSSGQQPLIAADIGNSRIKLGWFDGSPGRSLPTPAATLDLTPGEWDAATLAAWFESIAEPSLPWRMASVNRENRAALLTAAKLADQQFDVHELTAAGLGLPVELEHPQRVGIDRLLAAVAANRVREAGHPAVIVDLGSAITVDLVTAAGAFAGGAILPGIGMASRALAQQTDLLPDIAMRELREPPAVLGKSTYDAIRSGLFWGALGAVRELVTRLTEGGDRPPCVLLTGGAAPSVAALLGPDVRYEPHLVLAGIALAHEDQPR